MSRKNPNLIDAVLTLVEDTETPRRFWFWSTLLTITAALERRVWLPHGIDNLYPNLYVMLVAPPGILRKSVPLSLTKRLLRAVDIAIISDSSTKRAVTKEMSSLVSSQIFEHDGTRYPHCSCTIISKELSSLLAIDPKAMVELLTDLFDSHDEWEYKTSEKGTDSLHGVCLNLIAASTPDWIANNLPEGAIGGGLTSRFALIHATEQYKSVTLPPPLNKKLYDSIVWDLSIIRQLVGEFSWEPEAYQVYDAWYQTLGDRLKATPDERLHSFIARIHIMVIKVAMAMRVSYSDDLILTTVDINNAILALDDVLRTASGALGAQGRCSLAVDMDRIISQLRVAPGHVVTLQKLMALNYRHLTQEMLLQCVDTLSTMGVIRTEKSQYASKYIVRLNSA